MLNPGEIVVVSNPVDRRVDQLSNDKTKYVFVQKFMHEQDGIFYCERDDGKEGQIGWRNCRKADQFDRKYKYAIKR